MLVDPEDLDRKQRYRLMISCVVPRPIAWVTTRSREGVVNAAPYSFMNGISSDPPLLGVCIGPRRDGTPKDTLRNAQETGEMVVHMVPFEAGRKMVDTSRDYPPEVSEVVELGLATVPGERVSVPRLADSPVAMECRVERVIPFPGTNMVVGRVLAFFVRDDLLHDGEVDVRGFRPVGRLGGFSYLDLEEGVFELR